MEKPTPQKFASGSGCIYDKREEALHDSVEQAAIDLLFQLRQDGSDNVEEGAALMDIRKDVESAMKNLSLAFNGKLVYEYKLSK